MNKKLTSIVLVLCMLVSCVAVGSFATAAASTTDDSVSASSDSGSVGGYGLASNIEDGNILHCFDWKYSDIQAELPNIAAAGFTTVQTSPVQTPDPLGQWYGLYLPREFNCTSGPLGTKDELASLCSAAEQYGVKVICDVVANHLTGDHANIQNDLKDSAYWHPEFDVSDWNDRYQVTNGKIGMADLNTGHEYVQNVVLNYLRSLTAIGVDGFRFDAAKHIGLPSEGDGFWAKIAQIGTYRYGEILDSPGGGNPTGTMKEYANYIGITDSQYSGTIMGAVRDGSVNISYGGNWVNQGIAPEKIVYWAESHDTYSNDPPPKEGGWTKYIDQNKVDRAYAVVGAKAKSQSLYLSRPFQTEKTAIMSGAKGSTHFTATEVAAVNHFHNAMVGLGEYMTEGNNCYVVCRGDKTSSGGAVVVAASGSSMTVTVPNGGSLVPSGTYKDEVTGSTWTVNGSTMSGQIGSSGIAVIYDAHNGPSVSATPGSTTYTTDTLSVTLSYSDATSGTYSIDGGAAQSFSGSKTVTIGSGKDYGTKTTITVTATDGSETASETFTYTKKNPADKQVIYFDNSSYNWSNVYCYLYIGGATATSYAAWPGTAMTKGANNLYSMDVPDGFENGLVIFTESKDAVANRYPADGETGLSLGGESMIFKANHAWEIYLGGNPTTPTTAPTQPTTAPVGKVLIGDVNMDGNITIKDATLIQMHIAEMTTLTGNALVAANANKDSTVNVKDVTMMQRYLAHYTDSSCYVGTYTGGTEPVTQPTTQPQPTTKPTQPTTVPSGTVLYLKPGQWNQDNARFAIYCFNNSAGTNAWVDMTGSGETYSATLPSGTWDAVIFCRMNGATTENNWNNKWNQTADLTDFANGKTYVITGWDKSGNWQ